MYALRKRGAKISELVSGAWKTSAIRVSGVARYMFRNWVSGIGEAWMLDSNGYNNGSERVEEDLSGLLIGGSGEAGVWIRPGESIMVSKTVLGRGCWGVVWWLFGSCLAVV